MKDAEEGREDRLKQELGSGSRGQTATAATAGSL